MQLSVACNLILEGVRILNACWIAVCVLCRNAQMNLIVDTTCTCIVIMHFQYCQLPSCNLFTQHVSYLYGETPLVNCGPWSILLHLIIQPTAIIVFFHSLQTNIIFRTIRLILCFQQAGEIDNLTVKLGQSILVVLCAGSKSTARTSPLTQTIAGNIVRKRKHSLQQHFFWRR